MDRFVGQLDGNKIMFLAVLKVMGGGRDICKPPSFVGNWVRCDKKTVKNICPLRWGLWTKCGNHVVIITSNSLGAPQLGAQLNADTGVEEMSTDGLSLCWSP